MKKHKKDAYYFSHDANAQDDPKCMLLIEQLGMEGYGVFWGLIEKLRQEPNFKLPLIIVPALATRWRVSKEKIETIIKNFGLFAIDDDLFFSLRLQRSMRFYLETKKIKSKAGIKGNEIRWNKGIAEQSHSDNMAIATQSQLNETKVKESKEKESKENSSYSISEENKGEDFFYNFWNKYGKYIQREKTLEIWKKFSEEEKKIILNKLLPKYIIGTPDIKYRRTPHNYLMDCKKDFDFDKKLKQKTNGNPTETMEMSSSELPEPKGI